MLRQLVKGEASMLNPAAGAIPDELHKRQKQDGLQEHRNPGNDGHHMRATSDNLKAECFKNPVWGTQKRKFEPINLNISEKAIVLTRPIT